jgi:glycosyltransferase involved in cell wall biosynthesis
MQVSAIIPAFNEEKTIAGTVRALLSIGDIDEIIVVDDGSSDETAKVARQAGAVTLQLAENCGKGQALEVGSAISRGEILLLIDADLGDTAREASLLLEPVVTGNADMAVAIFSFTEGRGGFGLVEGLSRWAIGRSGGPRPIQPLSGQRALRRQVWQELGFGTGFGVETALSMGVHRCGYRMVEIPTTMNHRRTTRNWRGIVHRGRQFAHVLLAVMRRWRWLI